MRKQALVKAMAVKINALESKDERVQQAAASEIIEAELAKIEAGLGDELESLFRLPADTISGSFFDAYRDIQAHKHTEYVFKGGRGSTKSSFVSEVIIELLINNSDWHVLVTRQVANTLRDSVYSQLVWAINYLGLSDRFKCTTSPLEITYIPTDQKIYFRGGDDPLKIKSIKPRFGYINILWFEELDQFRGAAEVRSIVQSALRGGDQAYIFKSYNPPRSRSNWVNKQLEIPKDNRYIHESDYRSVPAEWLGQAFIDEAMFLKDVNPPAYEH
jgi:PBSX family phage terminase large subunit